MYNDHKVVASQLNDNQRLGLCMYLIELKYHFSGDGIWLQPLQQSEAYITTPLPEMPPVLLFKQYKYGRTPKTDKENFL